MVPIAGSTSACDISSPILLLMSSSKDLISSALSVLSVVVRDQKVLRTVGRAVLGRSHAASPPPVSSAGPS